MRHCHIRVEFKYGVKTKFPAALSQLVASFVYFSCHSWSYSLHRVKMNQLRYK